MAAEVRVSIWIDAPPAEVFSFIADLDNMAEFHPALVEISSTERLPNGGVAARFRQRGRGGRLLETTWDQVVFEPHHRLVVDSLLEGGIRIVSRRDLEERQGGTVLRVENRFELGHGAIGWLAERVWRGGVREELEAMLVAAKERLEARPQG